MNPTRKSRRKNFSGFFFFMGRDVILGAVFWEQKEKEGGCDGKKTDRADEVFLIQQHRRKAGRESAAVRAAAI